MSQLQQLTLQNNNCKTEIYLELHQQDIFINANGWITPELARQLISHLTATLNKK